MSSREKRMLFAGEPSVKLVSKHSSKGLEFETVLVWGLGRQTKEEDNPITEARLLYVAMTRAMSSLIAVQLNPGAHEIAL